MMPLDDEAFNWWREAVRLGPYASPPVNDLPQCGFYQTKLCKGGPFVPARIWLLENDPERRLFCEVDGRMMDPVEQWQWLAKHPIAQEQYLYMTAKARWARNYAPYDPLANPRAPIDHLQTPIRFLDDDTKDPDT